MQLSKELDAQLEALTARVGGKLPPYQELIQE